MTSKTKTKTKAKAKLSPLPPGNYTGKIKSAKIRTTPRGNKVREVIFGLDPVALPEPADVETEMSQNYNSRTALEARFHEEMVKSGKFDRRAYDCMTTALEIAQQLDQNTWSDASMAIEAALQRRRLTNQQNRHTFQALGIAPEHTEPASTEPASMGRSR